MQRIEVFYCLIQYSYLLIVRNCELKFLIRCFIFPQVPILELIRFTSDTHRYVELYFFALKSGIMEG